MKLAILGDIHIGARLDSPFYADYLDKFFHDEFFPYLEHHHINVVIQLGDLFDRKSVVDLKSFFRAKQRIFDEFEKRGIRLIVLVGNHDMAQRDSIEINAPLLLLKSYFEFEVVDHPKTFEFDGVEIDIVPWICKTNAREIHDFMKKSRAKIMCAHLQLTGFQMDANAVCKEGLDRAAFRKYDLVMSGHFHHRSDDGHVFYVGNPTQITWADFGDIRGFSVFDTETKIIEFVGSKLKFFNKIVYDDQNGKNPDIDYSALTGTYVKVIVLSKTDPVLFDKVITKIAEANPVELQILDDLVIDNGPQETGENVQVENTVNLLNSYVDEITVDVDRDKLKSLLHQLYVEAQTA